MSDTARDYQLIEPASTNGLDDLFEQHVVVDVAVVRSRPPEVQRVTLGEAAKRLGITRRSALRLVQEQKLAGAKDGHGQWVVSTDSVQARLHLLMPKTSAFEAVAVEDGQGYGLPWTEGHPDLSGLMQAVLCKNESQIYRNGWLESKLEELQKISMNETSKSSC